MDNGELKMDIGFRICKRERVAPKPLIEAYAKVPVANVSDSMSRMTARGMGAAVKGGGYNGCS